MPFQIQKPECCISITDSELIEVYRTPSGFQMVQHFTVDNEKQIPYDVLAFIHMFRRDDGELTR